MKTSITIVLLLLGATTMRAQMLIQSGATVTTTGSAIITLQNTGLRNNGTITQQAGGKFLFVGSNTDTISGTALTTTFDSLQIAKTGAGKLVLQQPIVANAAVKFTSGNIDLAGNILQLAPAAVLLGENTASRIVDNAQGGYVTITRALNAPSAANPGNLGAIITSTQNLGSTTIKRGHQSQVNLMSTGSSIKRYYDIAPANSTALNATLRVAYFDAELNGLPEADLNMYKSSNNTNWINMGYTTRDAVANYVEKSGIADFSRWTLSSFNNPLPLILTTFYAGCDGGNVVLDWMTAEEQQVSHFEVQRSSDAVLWEKAGLVPFAEGMHRYHFADIASKGFYRLAITDKDGSQVYSAVAHAACTVVADAVSLWPNPATGQVYIALATNTASDMMVKVYDSKGAAVLQQLEKLLPGNNKITLDLQRLANGVYWVALDWGAGRKSVKVVKQ